MARTQKEELIDSSQPPKASVACGLNKWGNSRLVCPRGLWEALDVRSAKVLTLNSGGIFPWLPSFACQAHPFFWDLKTGGWPATLIRVSSGWRSPRRHVGEPGWRSLSGSSSRDCDDQAGNQSRRHSDSGLQGSGFCCRNILLNGNDHWCCPPLPA